ncbi:sporulation inhibitor of replication protein SirA [Alkalihalophilus lindianensis]|uniref:Sporulation inhibitor of replication protein SirA n=1 Tax=Alkalihalophilus lindianensis TaxID=1630542 RepID=A0ABU3XDZ7_9BACI|nr:sporulation inhibitor of replication protein SirA [Alkalihalophilus lindianensis]MDV2685533.1 sporulation inhibitor of replication protein SirA [Alkalihalophilus lindianensis]
MRHYQLYLLEEDVAQHYFGQESKLFHLFLERTMATPEQKAILEMQIDYISKPMPGLLLQQKILSAFSHLSTYTVYKHIHVLDLTHQESCAELLIQKQHLTLTSTGEIEAETMFFEVLRKIDPCFFAVNTEAHRFGWLSPIKQVKFV